MVFATADELAAMKATGKSYAELSGHQETIPGLKPSRADKVYANNADKQAAYRARKDLKAVTIQLPTALADQLDAWLAAKGKGKSDTLARLIETQLLRKR